MKYNAMQICSVKLNKKYEKQLTVVRTVKLIKYIRALPLKSSADEPDVDAADLTTAHVIAGACAV